MTTATVEAPAQAGTITCKTADLPPLISAVAKAFPPGLQREIALRLLTYCAVNGGWRWVTADFMRRWLVIDLGEAQAAEAQAIGRQMRADGYILCELRDKKFRVFPTAKLIDAVRHAA